MSQFDTLLDFGESSPAADTNGSKRDSGAVDEFDPFGPSPVIEGKGSVDGNLLVDFTAETEISNGTNQNGASEPYEFSFDVETSNNVEDVPPADETNMSSSNPLYDMADEPATNPLYEFETSETMVKSSGQESSNPLYDLSNNDDLHIQTSITKSESSSSNPLYDLMSNGNNGLQDNDDFLIQTSDNVGGQQEQAYEEMTRPSDQTDNLVDIYENAEIETAPVREPSPEPVQEPTPEPIREPSPEPVREPSLEPVREPTPEPVREPSPEPFREPTPEPVREPTPEPVREPTPEPVREPTPEPVREPSPEPVREPSPEPVRVPTPEPVREPSPQPREEGQVVTRQEKRYSDSFADQSSGQSMGDGHIQQNGLARSQKEDIHFTEMSSVRNAFESGGPQQQREAVNQQNVVQWEEEEEEGVYENEPVQRPDGVVRESDKDIGAELPEVGLAKNLLNRFSQIGSEQKQYKREITPPHQAAGKVEFENQPASHLEIAQAQAEAGIFENQPQVNPNVVRSGETIHEPLPEQGTAKNIASRFKEMEKTGSTYTPSPNKRAITPDRSSGKVEYVSEPSASVEHYEGKAEAGIFESQPQSYEGVVRSGECVEDIMPERGSAKNIAQRFKQMENEPSSSPKGRREITPDRTTKGEYVSEPRARVETYEGRAEAGVFENRPAEREDVVKSDQILNEPLPEKGFTRNVAAKFKQLEGGVTSPPPTPGRVKEFTPPRETGVFESNPQSSPDVISEHQPVEEIVPERGYAKNLVSRFKQIEQENSKVAVSSRKKEITPPRGEAGVFENQPAEFQRDYNQKVDSGISENNPDVRSDVFKESDAPKYGEELPERGMAKNLVSRWKQMETSKPSSPSSGRVKEFTPPREEERVKAQRSPLMSPGGQFNSVQPGDLPGQYQQTAEPSIFESQPEQRPDVFREADTDWTDGMPKENAAKKMVAKFKHIQSEAYKEPPKPVSRKAQNVRRQ